MLHFNFVIPSICETDINASVFYVTLSKGITCCCEKGFPSYMMNCLTVPAETKQNTSLEDGRRDAMRQTLDYTPGTNTHAPVVFPAAAFSKAGHCALPKGSGGARPPTEVDSRKGASLLQTCTSLEARAPSTAAWALS